MPLATNAGYTDVTKDHDHIRTLLLQVWGQQACKNADQWPDALARMRVAQTNRRGSITPWIEHAVLALAACLASGQPVTGVDVWKAFSKLDVAHRNELAALLNLAWKEASY